jgi:hypothetical protein
MTVVNKLTCRAATLLVLFAFSSMPAKAQFAGLGGGGGADMMTQMAPMLNMMKAKMGKRRFAALMQTMGPMMGADGGGAGSFGGLGGGGGIPGDLGGMLGGGDGGGMGGRMSMIPQIMQMANFGGGGHHRYSHHRRR